MLINSKGSPSSPVWVLVDKPLSGDETRGYLYSAPTGFVFDKMMQEAGFKDYYVTCYRPDSEHLDSWRHIEGELNHYKPPIIIPLGAIGSKLLDCMIPNRRGKSYNDEKDSNISKYSGSLLSSPNLGYAHYIIPSYEPQDIIKQWKIRDIVINCDLGKAASELEYFQKHGTLQPLPQRTHKVDFDSFDELLFIIDSFREFPLVSNDIETIYPKAPTKTQPSQFYKIYPGYPLIIGLAVSSDFGISFDLFRDSNTETVELWRRLYRLLKDTPSLGQNFFNFDANFFRALGFRLPLEKCRDTMIRHHVLWPELKHSLQFMTRQYTREPYYKDEGHGWTQKNKTQWKIYNVKDVCVTMEIYNEQEKEFEQRPWLR